MWGGRVEEDHRDNEYAGFVHVESLNLWKSSSGIGFNHAKKGWFTILRSLPPAQVVFYQGMAAKRNRVGEMTKRLGERPT